MLDNLEFKNYYVHPHIHFLQRGAILTYKPITTSLSLTNKTLICTITEVCSMIVQDWNCPYNAKNLITVWNSFFQVEYVIVSHKLEDKYLYHQGKTTTQCWVLAVGNILQNRRLKKYYGMCCFICLRTRKAKQVLVKCMSLYTVIIRFWY